MGYLIAFTVQYIVLGQLFVFASAVLSLECGSYIWVLKSIENVKNDYSSFNNRVKARGNHSETLKQLSVSIGSHARVKQLSIFLLTIDFMVFSSKFNIWWVPGFNLHQFRIVYDLSEMLRPMLTALFSWSITTICSAMLIGQMIIVQYTCYTPFRFLHR